MNIIVERFAKIKSNIEKNSNTNSKTIVAVSKTFSLDHIMPLINHGHLHYGENKVQEAFAKWQQIKKENKKLKLHMIGKLQSNKAKKAVELFDFIHSLDSIKLANVLKKSEKELKKNLSYFIQINIGNESQKAGISPNNVKDFLKYCLHEINLNVIGLMVLPPNDGKAKQYFEETSKLNFDLGLKHLSMGMSGDYEIALKFKSTFLRIGSGILGPRALKN